MKDVNKVFFAKEGERGITAASANHICNIAKERANTLFSEVAMCSYVNETIGAIDSEVTRQCKIATPVGTESIVSAFEAIGKFHGLIAYLREAIKAKKDEETAVENMVGLDYHELCQKYNETPIDILRGLLSNVTIPSDFGISSLTVAERARYLYLEAFCSKIGKFIHPGGEFHKAVTEARDAKVNPIVKMETPTGLVLLTRSSCTYSYEQSLKNLYSLHRTTEAELNGLKAKAEKIQHEAEMEAAQKKAEGIRAYQDSISDKEAHYTMLKNKLSNEILKARKEVKNLKIVIPHMFEETFNVLNSK